MDTLLGLSTGSLADTALSFGMKRAVAYGMVALFLGALLFQSSLRRPGFIRGIDQKLWVSLGQPRFSQTFRSRVTWLIGAVALIASLGSLAHQIDCHEPLRRADAVRTALGAKYHNELGYFDLDKCTLEIGKTRGDFFNEVTRVRDVRTQKLIPVAQVMRGHRCAGRFTPERLKEFENDIDALGAALASDEWAVLFKESGARRTPFASALISVLLSLSGDLLFGLTALSLIDPLMMFAACGAVVWAFGVRKGALFIVFFCCLVPSRSLHLGESILRFDYVAALTIAVCAVKKGHWGWAGVLLAWATMARVFPALFAGALALKCASEIWEKGRFERRHEHFSLAFGASAISFLALSFVAVEGPVEDWRAWWETMRVHSHQGASFHVAFKHLFRLSGTGAVSHAQMQSAFDSPQLAYYVCVAFLLSPLLLSVRWLSASSFMTLFGGVGFFLLVISTRNYYGVLALLFLVDKDMFKNRTLLLVGALLFGSTAFDIFYFGTHPAEPLTYQLILGAQLALVVAALSLGVLFDPALEDGFSVPIDHPTLRERTQLTVASRAESAPLTMPPAIRDHLLPSIVRRT